MAQSSSLQSNPDELRDALELCPELTDKPGSAQVLVRPGEAS